MFGLYWKIDLYDKTECLQCFNTSWHRRTEPDLSETADMDYSPVLNCNQ